MKKLAFISHSSRDKDRAKELVAALRERGVEVWIDHERIGFGDSIPGKIAQGLQSADVILVLVSIEFVGSQWCRSEYEPLIVREIESGRTAVIPVRLDNAEMPVFLQPKRYVDFRSGMSATTLDELAEDINTESTIKTLRSLPKAPSYHASILSMVIGGLIEGFPVSSMTDEQLMKGRSLVELYRAIEKMICGYQNLVDEILGIWRDSGMDRSIYGSANRVSASRVQSANRKLLDIAADMRSIAAALHGIVNADSILAQKLRRVLDLCATISIAEDFLIVKLGSPSALSLSDRNEWGILTNEIEHCDIHDNAGGHNYPGELGQSTISDFENLLSALSVYRRDLRLAIAEAASHN